MLITVYIKTVQNKVSCVQMKAKYIKKYIKKLHFFINKFEGGVRMLQ